MTFKKVIASTLGTATALAAALIFQTASANADTKVTVKPGDTVWEFSQKYDTTIKAIEDQNNITGHLIVVGEVLDLPTANTTQTTSNTTYSAPQTSYQAPSYSTPSSQSSYTPSTNKSYSSQQSQTSSTSTQKSYSSSATGSSSSAKS
ncbi:cell wall-associated hydrolase [Secundilactobacillus oryzae JCM 18671]|uniref:Cell wall-associated hydrolase n=1 Tax=Secundilactobacillus oryzae JCM 18671 TaxID=1291743 RepID=A0A081BGB9_9LACO|nr:cell wall-associated hydrolase [Secundilactobacillus oryzae JCM 18671]